jgi:hypothetical protein
MTVKRSISVAGLAVATGAVLAWALPGIALADTAQTSVGTLTATEQAPPGNCNDLGANVSVTVTGGFANTAYTVSGGGISVTKTFTSSASGSGSVGVTNVNSPTGSTGTGTITVTAAGSTGTVAVVLDCAGGKGD